jgi:hypothetical protein
MNYRKSLLSNSLQIRRKFLALASWCARAGVERFLLPGGAASGRSDSRTNWRAPGENYGEMCGKPGIIAGSAPAFC